MFLVIIVEVKKGGKERVSYYLRFALKGIGFIKKGGAYYLIHGSELVGAVYLRKSSYGSVYYVECGIAIHGYNEAFPFPKYHDVDISTRFQFPLKVHRNMIQLLHMDILLILNATQRRKFKKA